MNIPPRIGIAYPAFFSSFSKFFPGLTALKSTSEVRECDLIIFSGGEDLNPATYGQSPTHTSYYSSERDSVEMNIFSEAKRRGTKMLGVCRGHQLINVCLGGNLYQDIYFEAGASHAGDHEYTINYDSSVMSAIPPIVNSLHHQGIARRGSGIVVLAEYRGIPEVCATLDNKIITVQFHPEFANMVSFFEFIKSWITDSDRLNYSEVSVPRKPKISKLEELLREPRLTTVTGRPTNPYAVAVEYRPSDDAPEEEEEPEEEQREEEDSD